jgi:hypothetical protein
MTPEDYQFRWNRNGKTIFPVNPEKLSLFSFKPETIRFLKIGLPKSAAPFLSFNQNIGSIGQTFLLDEIQPFCAVIGSDGAGNPIVINVSEGDIVEWLDHENNFESSYFNSSIESMLEFLLVYREFLETMLAENGEDAAMNSIFTDSQFKDMKQKMLFVDAKALFEAGFWKEELESLIAERTYYANGGSDQS